MNQSGPPTERLKANPGVILLPVTVQNMGRWRGVLALYDWMAQSGVHRTLYIYTIVLESLGRARQWQLLNRVVADLHRQGEWGNGERVC